MALELMCSFDLETTGIDVTTDKIVTGACVDIDATSGSTVLHEWLANPGIDIPQGASDVHGVTTEIAKRDGRDHDTVLWEIINHIYSAWDAGATLVVYNAAYDLSMLYVLSQGQFDYRRGPIVDPLVLDKHFDKYRKGSRKLVNVAEHYGIVFDEDSAHAADADALASARVAYQMANKFYPHTWPSTSDALHAIQAAAKLEQFTSLKNYFERQGKVVDGDGLWPVQQIALDKVK